MRLLDWLRGSRLSDDLDSDLTTLLARRDPQERLSPARLAQARARVDAQLRADERSASLLRRLALAAVGGGSMWTGLVGIAAAHKAAAVTAGLGLILGGSVAAEASGVGPAVRTAMSSAAQVEATSEADLLALQLEGDEETRATVDASATAAADALATATVGASATGAVGASATVGHDQCVEATEQAQSVLSAHLDGSLLAQVDVLEQATAGLSSEARVQVENALATLEECGLGTGDIDGGAHGTPATAPSTLPVEGQQGLGLDAGLDVGLDAELEADVEVEGGSEADVQDDASAGVDLGLGLDLGVGERTEGAGQP